MRPPQHSIDANPIFVLIEDPAWDTDRVDQELEGLDNEARAEHPYLAYHSGSTRYDLNARVTWAGGEGSASDYLGDGACRFTLQRLAPDQFAEIVDSRSREYRREGENASFVGVWVKAARYGIRAIDGDAAIRFPSGARMSDGVMRQICDRHGGVNAITQIGLASWMLSQPLSEAEGKR